MIQTLSMCPVCYKKIPADISVNNGAAWMFKECPEHGHFSAMVEKDASIINNFYNTSTLGLNNSILVPVYDACNMECPWCFYDMKGEPIKPALFYDRALLDFKIKGYNLLLSGGEPTLRPDFFDFSRILRGKGWEVFTMSNMLKFGEEGFFKEALEAGYIDRPTNTLKASFSMQHPKNYSVEVYKQKMEALINLERFGVQANCIQFSISSLDELAWIRQFYNDTKRLYKHLRIRTMYGNWKDKGNKNKLWLSDLYKEFLSEFSDLIPTMAGYPETSNMYSIYMKTQYGGISLSSAPTVENVDLISAGRPTLSLASDGKCYSVPVAQIVSEGIDKGWYNGFPIKESNHA